MDRVRSKNEEKRNLYGILVGKPERKRPIDIGRKIILKWILEL
jgi:hypothetical protein